MSEIIYSFKRQNPKCTFCHNGGQSLGAQLNIWALKFPFPNLRVAMYKMDMAGGLSGISCPEYGAGHSSGPQLSEAATIIPLQAFHGDLN